MRLRRRRRRSVPGINTASIADISFTLLILFLVITSMDVDKGHTRLLPPVSPNQEERAEGEERDVLHIAVMGKDQVAVEGVETPLEDICPRVMLFVDNPLNDPSLPAKHLVEIPLLGSCRVTSQHVIQLSADNAAPYDTYFKVQDAIVQAYSQLREELAQSRFGRGYRECDEAQREALRKYYPQRVSEVYPKEGGQP